MPEVRVRGRSHPGTDAPSELTCDLRRDAAIQSDGGRLVLAPVPELGVADGGRRVQIHVRTEGSESFARQVVSPAASWWGRKWHSLRVQAPAAGSAHIVLTTRCAEAATQEVGVLWGSPESRRRVRLRMWCRSFARNTCAELSRRVAQCAPSHERSPLQPLDE